MSPSSKRRSQTLQPIIEGETAHFCDEIKEEEEDERKGVGGGDGGGGGGGDGGGGREDKEEERDDEEEEEEEEGESSSGGEMQSSEVIMAIDPDGPMRSQSDCPERDQSQTGGPMRGKLEEGSGKLALDLRLSSSNASSM